MKLTLDRNEVESILTGYATNTLGLRMNSMDVNGDGSVDLLYTRERERKRAPFWSRFKRHNPSQLEETA